MIPEKSPLKTVGKYDIITMLKKDTKESSSTHPPASTSHGKFSLILDQSVLSTSMLQGKRKRKGKENREELFSINNL